jgi:chromosome segregation ATPase
MLTFASVLAGLALLGSGASAGVSLALYLRYRAKVKTVAEGLSRNVAGLDDCFRELRTLKESITLVDTNHGLLVEAGKTMEAGLEALSKRVELAGETVELCSGSMERLQGEVAGLKSRVDDADQLIEVLDAGMDELSNRIARDREEVGNAFQILAIQEQARAAQLQGPVLPVQPQGEVPGSVAAARQTSTALNAQLAELTRRLTQVAGQQAMPS